MLSPHLDDAVLSAGQFLAGRPHAVVVTLFGGTPPDARRVVTSYDRDCGFVNADHAMRLRRAEDRAALGLLEARRHVLMWLDHQYRGDVTIDEAQAVTGLLSICDRHRITEAFGPVGLAHPDHVSAARVFMDLLTVRPSLTGWLYEELPSRVLWPEQVGPALDVWRRWWPNMVPDFPGTGPLEVKEEAMACYRSQLWALDPHAVRCPERFWRLGARG